ncbi:hypothetical protein DNTS_003785 [Danionella cerebrum]|uniref:Uncharacterized protein n=1 Tax=Danionella cerebrum TaxID=2873325 RepID=A0A553NKP0_9TELE|nr:hypothetical protein DNTS_003785 [Danionella translucida]
MEMSQSERSCKKSDGIELLSMASVPEDSMLSGDFRGKFKKSQSRKRPTILACRQRVRGRKTSVKKEIQIEKEECRAGTDILSDACIS